MQGPWQWVSNGFDFGLVSNQQRNHIYGSFQEESKCGHTCLRSSWFSQMHPWIPGVSAPPRKRKPGELSKLWLLAYENGGGSGTMAVAPRRWHHGSSQGPATSTCVCAVPLTGCRGLLHAAADPWRDLTIGKITVTGTVQPADGQPQIVGFEVKEWPVS